MTDQRDGASPPTEAAFDLRGLYVRFSRRLPVFLAVAAAVMVCVGLYTFTQKPAYSAVAQVLIEPRKTDMLDSKSASAAPQDSASIDTQVQVITSRDLSQHLVERLHLDKDPAFAWAIKGGAKAGGVKGLIKSLTRASSVAPVSETAGLDAQQLKIAPVVDFVRDSLQARRVGLSYIIQISYTADNPALAARMANEIAAQYQIDQTDAKMGVNRGANAWLDSRLRGLAAQVETDEAAVQRYKIANNLMSANGATMAEQEVSTLNQQIAASRAELAEKQARYAAAQGQLSRGGGGGDVGAVLGSDVVRDLRSKKAEVSRRQAELLTRYGPLHPEVRKVERELADINDNINQEITRVLSNLKAEVQVAEQRAASLEASRGRARGSLASNNSATVELMELQRRAEASRAIYEAFLNRSKETAATEGVQQPDSRITSRAEVPVKPSSPNIPLYLALGMVLAVTAGLGAVILIENLDSGLRTSTEVEALLNVPSVGAVPLIPSKEKVINRVDYVLQKPLSAFAEAFRSLKTSLMFSRSDKPIRVIAVTSSLPGEGKTLTTLSLGRSMAANGAKVVILDGDLRRHALTSALNKRADKGLIQLMEGTATLDEVLFLDSASGAQFIFCNETDDTKAAVVDGARLAQVLEQLKAQFDFILIDTAPVLAVADTRVLASHADVVLFLCRWGKTPRQAAMASIEMLLNAGAYLAGVCLTQVDLDQQSRLGYGDKLYYYQAYKKYYAD